MSGMGKAGAEHHIMEAAAHDADYHAAVIQSHWRGHSLRKSLREMQLGDTQLQQYGVVEPQWVANDDRQQEQQIGLQQQLDQGPTSSGCTHGLTQYVQQLRNVWSKATGTLIRNRGILQANLASRRQTVQQQREHKLQAWCQFAERQAKRYVRPPPASSNQRRLLAEPACYRLRIVSVSNLPQLLSSQRNGDIISNFELRLGVSLFDEAAGAFYGSTCYSQADIPMQQQQQHDAASCEFCFDVFFHSVISDPRCMAVVEVIMVERDAADHSAGQFSVGWAQLPLFADAARLGPIPGSQAAAAPLMSGTPRYLMFRSVCGENLPEPRVIQGCHVTYQAEVYPAMSPARALLPQDFLVAYSDVLPGLRRFDTQGQLTSGVKASISTLASPVLAPGWVLQLAQLQLAVPQVLHNLLSVLPQLVGVMPPPGLPALLAVPSQPAAVQYTLCIGAHNGRTYVGPQLLLQQLQVQPSLGCLILRPDSTDGSQQRLDWVPADELVVLVLELLATPVGAAAEQDTVLVGRAALLPFEEVSRDGKSAVLATGLQKCALSSSSRGPCCPVNLLGGVTEGMLQVNWRALLQDTAVRAVPDPAVQVELLGSPADVPLAAGAAAAAALATLELATLPPQQQHQHVAMLDQHAVSLPQPAEAAPAAAVTAAPRRESAAVRHLKQACKQLQEAASIPVEELSEPGSPTHTEHMTDSRQGDGSNQQLRQLADTMQQQIGALARAVEDLKEERNTLRSSLNLLESAVAAHSCSPQHQQQPADELEGAAEISSGNSNSRPSSSLIIGGSSSSSISPSELERLKALQAAVPGLSGPQGLARFSGAQAASLAQQQGGDSCAGRVEGTPSRAVMQQLHEAGMMQALPADVQVLLKRTAATASPSKGHKQHRLASNPAAVSPLVLELEARDPRTASDVVLQLLAFRPAGCNDAAARLPAGLRSLYFTTQFYHFGPVVTEPCLLAAGESGQDAAFVQQQQLVGEAAGRQTFVLLPTKQVQRSGAGLVFKYNVDGSAASQLLPGQPPAQAAFDSHMAFCCYLAKHRLAIDVWDADSLLQLGTCSISLQGLLRQGQELSELLLEVPLLQTSSNSPSTSAADTAALLDSAAAAAAQHGLGRQLAGQQSLQLGHLVLRLINIGREPGNTSARVQGFDAAEAAAGPGTPGKKVRVRAVPLQPGSPVAKELRGGQPRRSPFTIDWLQQQQEGQGGSDVPAAAAANIISFEQRKIARAQQLRQLLSSPAGSRPGSAPGTATPSPPRHAAPGSLASTAWGGSGSASAGGSPVSRTAAAAAQGVEQQGDPFKAVQRQLLADVDAVRKRQKAGFIRSQLSKDLVTSCTLQPCQGQVLLLEHVLTNSLGRDAVFEVRVSHPDELQAIESVPQYRQLHQAVGAGIPTSAAAAAAGAGAAAAGASTWGAVGAPSLARLAEAGGHVTSSDVAGQLVSKGRIFLAANERVSIPFTYRLPGVSSNSSSSCQVQADGLAPGAAQQQQQERVVTAELVPLELDYPVNVLQLKVKPRPLIIDRTLRYHCPERDVMRVAVLLGSSTSSAAAAAAASGACLVAASSRHDVTVSVSGIAGAQRQQQQLGGAAAAAGVVKGQAEVHIKYKCGASPDVVQFLVWLYADASMAQPLEVWQVFVHALQKVDMRAVVGQSSSTSLAVAGGTTQRQVACYSSHPDELQAAPDVLQLSAGGISALQLVFKPLHAGKERVRIHLVDTATRQLVHALIVATEAAMPSISRTFEVEIQAGTVAERSITYASPYQQPRVLSLCSSAPWLLSCEPSSLQLLPRGSQQLRLVFDARGQQAGARASVLLFVNDEEDRNEEVMEIAVSLL